MGQFLDQRCCGYLTVPHAAGYLKIDVKQTNRGADTIRLNKSNTVKSLRDQLQSLLNAGHDDSGFPILRTNGNGMRMVGFIGTNELEHALGKPHRI